MNISVNAGSGGFEDFFARLRDREPTSVTKDDETTAFSRLVGGQLDTVDLQSLFNDLRSRLEEQAGGVADAEETDLTAEDADVATEAGAEEDADIDASSDSTDGEDTDSGSGDGDDGGSDGGASDGGVENSGGQSTGGGSTGGGDTGGGDTGEGTGSGGEGTGSGGEGESEDEGSGGLGLPLDLFG